jgi:hypothetical protein
MVTKPGRFSIAFALAAGLMLTAPACASLGGGLEGVTVPRGRDARISGQVHSLDRRRNQIMVREGFGRTHTLRYDNRTRVLDGRRQYAVSALDRGDQVRVWVTYDRRGTPWVERLEVRESARNRSIATPRVERLDGRVARLDTRRNFFTLEQGRNQTVMVRVPSRLQRDDARRLERLRRGDRVRVDVRALDRNTVELIRFR